MYRLKGSIDFARLPATLPASLPVIHEASWCHCHLPGISLQWHQDHVDASATNDCLVIAAGRPRFASGVISNKRSAPWLDRYQKTENRAPFTIENVGGGFSAVILDLRRRRCLLLNDRFAIGTLCYRVDKDEFAFADGAAAVPGHSATIDPQAIYDYLYFHMIPAPATVFPDVRRLRGGEVVAVGAGVASVESLWRPRFIEGDFTDLPGRLDRFRQIIRDSVAEEADEKNVACFLSGGTDSSTIAGMLTRVSGRPAPAYSIGFEAEGYDEMAYARLAARHFGLDHHEYYLTPDDLVEAIPKVATAFDQPFGNSSILPTYYCALKAQQDGYTRMLAGDGGDELFGGNSRYATQKLFQIYHRLPKTLRGLIEPPAVQWPIFRRVPGLRQLGGYVRHARIPMPDRMESFNLLHGLDDGAMFEPAFRAQIDTGHPSAQQSQSWQDAEAESLVNKMLYYDWKYTLADSDLPKVRTATQLAGVSVAYPFLSREMTELSLAVPPRWKVKDLKLRWFFKEALRDILPREILRKKKHGFGLPFGHWTLRHGGLHELAADSLKGIGERGIVRRDFIKQLLEKRLPEAPGYHGEMVWILMMLEQWLRGQAGNDK